MLPTQPDTPPDSTFWRVVHFPLVLLVIAGLLLMAGGFVVNRITYAIDGGHPSGVDLIGRLVTMVVVVSIYWMFVRFVERRRTIVELGRHGWFGELSLGWLAGIALFSLVVGVIALLGGYRILGFNAPAVLLVPFVVSLASGVTEEILFRGLFFRLVERLLGSWIALALSAALFGAAHLANAQATAFAALAIALEAGIMLGALYMVTRRLWAAIGLHAAWNFAQGGIFGVAVSGSLQQGLVQPHIAGSTLLTGGSFGAEASLPAVVIDTAFGVILMVIAWRRNRPVAPIWARRSGEVGPADLKI